MKKFFRIALWTIVALIFVGTFVYLYKNSQDKPTVYETVRPHIGTIERTTLLTGKIEPRDEIDIKPQISGIIAEINVEPGDRVKVGDVIARIKVIPEESQLSAAENRVEVARRNLELQESKYKRTSELYEKKFISREEYEEGNNAVENARIELNSALDALSIVRDGVSVTNAQQSNTLVRSTIDGIVLAVPVKEGSSVIQANTFNDGTTIATVADMRDLLFVGKVDETEVGMLAIGMPLTVSHRRLRLNTFRRKPARTTAPAHSNSRQPLCCPTASPCARATAPTVRSFSTVPKMSLPCRRASSSLKAATAMSTYSPIRSADRSSTAARSRPA